MIELLLDGKLEPPSKAKLHLSTLVHQTLSCTRQWGALSPERLYQILCESGPFRNVDPNFFADVLRSLKLHGLIAQGTDDAIVLAKKGDEITSKYDFYAAFMAGEDYTIRFNENTIGLLPATDLPRVGQLIILNGRRWRVDAIKHREKTVEVTPAEAGSPPSFGGDIGDVHTIVFKRMQQLLRSSEFAPYLNPTAVELIRSARATAKDAGICERSVLAGNSTVFWFPWVGTKALRTLRLFAKLEKLECAGDGLCLAYPGLSKDRLITHLTRLTTGKVDLSALAGLMEQKRFQKFDQFLDEKLLDQGNGNDRLDIETAQQAAAEALKELGQ